MEVCSDWRGTRLLLPWGGGLACVRGRLGSSICSERPVRDSPTQCSTSRCQLLTPAMRAVTAPRALLPHVTPALRNSMRAACMSPPVAALRCIHGAPPSVVGMPLGQPGGSYPRDCKPADGRSVYRIGRLGNRRAHPWALVHHRPLWVIDHLPTHGLVSCECEGLGRTNGGAGTERSLLSARVTSGRNPRGGCGVGCPCCSEGEVEVEAARHVNLTARRATPAACLHTQPHGCHSHALASASFRLPTDGILESSRCAKGRRGASPCEPTRRLGRRLTVRAPRVWRRHDGVVGTEQRCGGP